MVRAATGADKTAAAEAPGQPVAAPEPPGTQRRHSGEIQKESAGSLCVWVIKRETERDRERARERDTEEKIQ